MRWETEGRILRLEMIEFQIRACFALVLITIILNHFIIFFQFRKNSLFAFRGNAGTSSDKHLPSKNSRNPKKGIVPLTGDSYRD